MTSGRLQALFPGLGGLRKLLVALAVLIAPVAACSEDPFAPQVIEEVEFFAGLGIDLASMIKLSSGIYISDDSIGTGAQLEAGDSVNIDHRGWLADGTLFSSGAIDGSPYPTGFISGFSMGMAGMFVGGQRLMIIPPEHAWGNTGSGPIPPGAVVVFEVELIDAY